MINEMKTVAIIAAHPDDEALGCGGTIARLADIGAQISILFLADGETSRSSVSPHRGKTAREAAVILGAGEPTFLDYPDNQLDSIPLLTLAQSVEAFLLERSFDTVFTHHAGDLNIDHRLTLQAVLTACRPLPGMSVKQILSFEVPSASHWAADILPSFVPNFVVDISSTLDRKQQALRAYHAEMRPSPHARSHEAVHALATWRGHQHGIHYAEAFQLIRAIS
ncbi:MAG: hypothetical protein RL095_375 [Verrucomicrobiota bacterium]|jgi:LmbE family N-acetylglucosaminyl deacetylase